MSENVKAKAINPKEIVIPTLVLVLITLAVSILLVLTNSITKDRIAELQIQADNEARQAVLPAAGAFEEKVAQVNGADVTYWEGSDASGSLVGYVFQTSFKGYGGPVVVMTGISADGSVAGVKLTEQDETPGLGQRALESVFTDQYVKAIPDGGFAVTKSGAASDNEINALAGATITSRAVTNSVNQAIEIFKTVTGGAAN